MNMMTKLDYYEDVSSALDTLGSFDGKTYFLCCASYEERSSTIITELSKKQCGVNVDLYYISRFKEFNDFNDNVYNQITSLIDASKVRSPELSVKYPIQTSDELMNVFSSNENCRTRYLIDITTFTHEALLILLQLCSLHIKRFPTDSIVLLYSTAKEYSYNKDTPDKWLSKGIADIRSVLGYSGELTPLRKNHLLILVGYEHERASGLIEQLQPDCLSLGCGTKETSITPEQHDVNKYFNDLLRITSSIYGNTHSFEVFCNNPISTAQKILGYLENFRDYNTIIAPMNTKLSTIGVALAAFQRDDIQICYAQPEYYNFEYYSISGKSCYVINWMGDEK